MTAAQHESAHQRPDVHDEAPTRSGRFTLMDAQPINLDGLSVEDEARGLVAMSSRNDPVPELVIRAGKIVRMDGKCADDFDIIDHFIARHGVALDVGPEVMAMPDELLARLLVDPSVSRTELVRLSSGMTPAKMSRVVSLLEPVEMQMAIAKMRARRTPSNQAHVTNRLDDPLLIAADAATAVAFGFRELEATVPVLADAPAVAVALLIGSQVGAPGALTQCSVEEAQELQLGMKGLVSYAETVSIYGTQGVFVDGDDTPWSKALLVSAYASRGVKMRVSSGAGAEVLMGDAEGCSMNYLEARCVVLAHALGTQGVQNGGIDGASVAASVPRGVRELLSENLMVMLRGLESCSGNDALMSESDVRRTSRTLPLFLAGSDFICSGFGSIPKYDNMFGPSNWNANDIDDYLIMQRDWGIDGGLRSADESTVIELRRAAVKATAAVFCDLGLAEFTDQHQQSAIFAEGSKDIEDLDEFAVGAASRLILDLGISAVDVVQSLDSLGYDVLAQRLIGMLAARKVGDHLQTSAIFDQAMNVLSLVTDPNDYAGPGTGYRPGPQRWSEINAVRQAKSVADLLADQAGAQVGGHELVSAGAAGASSDPRDVVIGVSPAFGRELFVALSGLSVFDILIELSAGLEEEGCRARVVRFSSSVDLGAIGLAAARLSGSGVGIGLQAKGTALIHRRDLSPLSNLELFSMAPLISKEMYRLMGTNAGRYAKGAVPAPVRNAYTDEAIEARYHARVVSMTAVEASCVSRERGPEQLDVVTRQASSS